MDGEHQVATGVVSGMMVLLKFILFVFQLLLSLSSTFSSDGAATRAWPSRSQAAMNGKIHGVRMSTGEGPCGRCEVPCRCGGRISTARGCMPTGHGD